MQKKFIKKLRSVEQQTVFLSRPFSSVLWVSVFF